MQNPRRLKATMAQRLAYENCRWWLRREIAAGQQPPNLSEEDTEFLLEGHYPQAARLQPYLPEFQDGWASVLFGLLVEGFEPIPLEELEAELAKLRCQDLEDVQYFEQVFLDLQYRRALRHDLVAPHEPVVFHWLATQRQRYSKVPPTEDPGEPGAAQAYQQLQPPAPPANDVVVPPHTWGEIDALAQRVGILNGTGVYALGYQQQSGVAGFIDALRKTGYLKGFNKVLHPIFGKRYSISLKTDGVTNTRRDYEQKTLAALGKGPA